VCVYACGYFQRTFSSTLCCWLLGKYLQPRLLIYRGINFDVPGLGVLYVRSYVPSIPHLYMTGSRGVLVLLNAWRAHNPLSITPAYIHIHRAATATSDWALDCFNHKVATARHTKEVFPTVKVKVDATDVYAGKLQNFNYASHTHRPLPFCHKQREVLI
jgi:hypothetical protein